MRCGDSWLLPIFNDLSRYIDEYKWLGLDEEPNYDFLGHPINGYLFLRHVAFGWGKIKKSIKDVDLNATDQYGKNKELWNSWNRYLKLLEPKEKRPRASKEEERISLNDNEK